MSDAPTPVPPDTKDWTWVLQRPCPECGFVAADLDVSETGAQVRASAARLAELVRDPRAGVRPTADRWSGLEYACHVRDVFRLYDLRLHLMLDEDDPLFANWDQDEMAIADRYDLQDPSTVASELEASAAVLAASFDEVTPEQLTRPGRRSDGASFTIETFSRYFLHDPVHHIWDVEQGYADLS